MKILTEKDFPLKQHTAVAIGLFDGIHLGHTALLDDVLKQRGRQSAVYTFDSKPAAKEHIYNEEEKRSIISGLGIDLYYTRNFDKAFSGLSPADFLEGMVRDLNVKHITVGFDFRFGKKAAGDAAFLAENAERYGYILHIIPEVDVDGYKVGSSLIREMIRAGNVAEAKRLLGRFYFIDGAVGSGKQIGSSIGFPTANMITDKFKLLPSNGVYATIAHVEGKLFRAVSNVGTKPTVKTDDKVNIETFLMDFDKNIYGKHMRVFFVEKLRGEVRFGTMGELKSQIGIDSAQAAEKLRDLAVYKPYILC